MTGHDVKHSSKVLRSEQALHAQQGQRSTGGSLRRHMYQRQLDCLLHGASDLDRAQAGRCLLSLCSVRDGTAESTSAQYPVRAYPSMHELSIAEDDAAHSSTLLHRFSCLGDSDFMSRRKAQGFSMSLLCDGSHDVIGKGAQQLVHASQGDLVSWRRGPAKA